MNIGGAIIIFVIVWWTVFFAVLPWGVKGVWEEKDKHIRGADQGAPVDPQLKIKALRTTWIAAIITAIVIAVIMSGVLSYNS